ncbi:MAG: hypothetical protein ACK4QW_04025 [Alphaproteobacteria bacterium]
MPHARLGQLVNVQNLVRSDFNDVLIGGAGDDTLDGGSGDNTLIGVNRADLHQDDFAF